MLKKIILAASFLFCCINAAFSQFTIGITGPASLSYEGGSSDFTFTITYNGTLPSKYSFVATAVNGTVVSQSINPTFPPARPVPLTATVQWNCIVGTGSITVTEINSGASATFNVSIHSFISDPNYCTTA